MDRKNQISRIRYSLHRKWPDLFPDPSFEKMLATWQRRDDEKNAKSSPPSAESICIRGIWALELYGPMEIDGLIDSLREHNWSRSVSGSQSIEDWIREGRKSRGGRSCTIAPIVREEDKRDYLHPNVGFLPEFAESAFGQFHCLTSSLSCLVVCFVMKASETQKYEKVLRTEFATSATRRRKSYQVQDPVLRKRGRIAASRSKYQAECDSWFKSMLPGLFTNESSPRHHPCCELLTLDDGQPFKKYANRTESPKYMDLLGVSLEYNAWHSEELPGFRLSPPMYSPSTAYLVLAANQNDVPDDKLEPFGGKCNQGYVNWAHTHMDAFLSRWALLSLCRAYEQRLTKGRDLFQSMASKNGTMQAIKFIESELKNRFDLSALSDEVMEFVQSKSMFNHNVARFKAVAESEMGEDDLSQLWADRIINKMSRIGSAEQKVREYLAQYLSAKATLFNTRLQMQVWVLTALMVILAIIAIWIELA